MPDHSWTCRVCGEENPAYTEVCRDCYVPYGQGTSVRRCKCGELIDGKGPDCQHCEREKILLRRAAEPEPETVGRWNDDGVYIPNKYSKRTLIGWAIHSTSYLLIAALGFSSEEVSIITLHPITYTSFHGGAAWAMCGGLMFWAVSTVALIVDHFDHRPNEDMYRRISLHSMDAAWVLIAIAFGLQWTVKP